MVLVQASGQHQRRMWVQFQSGWVDVEEDRRQDVEVKFRRIRGEDALSPLHFCPQ